MRILFIGGTRWVGKTMVRTALDRGHTVTLFNRGQTSGGIPDGVERVVGDRATDLGRLEGAWDAVVDTCGYLPIVVKKSVDALRNRVGRYLFVSSISVLDAGATLGCDEDGPRHTMDDPWTETFSMEHYGALKAKCEDVVLDAFGDRGLVIRPGLIVGPGDYSDRFTYWPVRFSRGGRIVAPDRPRQPVQFIDVRDLAEFGVGTLEDARTGAYLATGPAEAMHLAAFLQAVRSTVGSVAEIVWAPAEILERHAVEPWSDLPLVLPYSGSDDGMAGVSIRKALDHGLLLRPLAETSADTLRWYRERGDDALKVGLTPEREAAILADLGAGTDRPA
ncbi:MAG: hypothetical protein KIS66_07910 [Fimbriimonadaceae bacterium]|nr:hypothetical protein [Fimbriimonadaceae bacterium]